MNSRYDFRLSLDQLQDISAVFLQRLREGLRADNTEIKCLPTFVAVDAQPPRGDAYVLDLGGSNLRAAYVDLNQATVSDPLARQMPWQRGIAFPKERYLDEQASLLAAVPQQHKAPLGYCFSYPAASQPDGDARLIRWTKGVVVPDTVGELVGADLLNYLAQHYNRHYASVAVVNDTVTSLLAGLTLPPVDTYAGLIVGTGMNLAALLRPEQLPKLGPDRAESETRLPVNLESGNFHPPHLTPWDDELDRLSENPGEQRIEKAVAGMYLGRIFALANPDLSFDRESGARGLVNTIQTATDSDLRESALSLYQRSAQLVAAKLAGLATFYRQQYGAESLRIVAEGGLAWSAIDERLSYQQLLLQSLQALLNAADLSNMHVEIVRVDNANLIGAAVAAVANPLDSPPV